MTNRLFLDLDLDRRNPFERHTVKDILAMILIAVPVTADAKCWFWQRDCSDGGGSRRSWQNPKLATSWPRPAHPNLAPSTVPLAPVRLLKCPLLIS